jgi:hypothetical protein
MDKLLPPFDPALRDHACKWIGRKGLYLFNTS